MLEDIAHTTLKYSSVREGERGGDERQTDKEWERETEKEGDGRETREGEIGKEGIGDGQGGERGRGIGERENERKERRESERETTGRREKEGEETNGEREIETEK